MKLPLLAVALLIVLAAPVAARDRAPDTSFRDARDAPEMVVVPAGSALLGSTEAETTREGRAPGPAAFERPQHRVTFPALAVGRYLVTKREFDIFARATKRPMAGCVVAIDGKWSDGPVADKSYRDAGFAQRPDEPAVCVNWDDAVAYARWLGARTDKRYRLLSEDEWEYAARGGSAAARWWGDGTQDICARINGGDRDYAAVMPADTTANLTCADGYAHTSPAGRFAPNPFGLSDMLGNAWQWVDTCFTPVPGAPARAGSCVARSIRGGSWHSGVASLRPAVRFSLPVAMRSSSVGFRVMRDLP